jgi:hypothetical protein
MSDEAKGGRVTEMHARIVQTADAADTLLKVPFALAYVMTQLSHLGQENVEAVLKGLVTLKAKLDGP